MSSALSSSCKRRPDKKEHLAVAALPNKRAICPAIAIKQQYIAGIITSSRAIAGCNSATCTLLFNPFQTTGLSSGLIATKCGWGASLNWKVEMSQETKGVSPLQPPESGGSRKHTKGRDESTLNPTALNPKPLNPKP